MATVVGYLFLLALIAHCAFPSAKSQMLHPSSTSHHATTGFEFIDALNLHPKLDVNIYKPNTSDSASITNSRVVENPIRLPVLGESGASIDDLAHLAGYVRINHTIGSRMFYFFFQSRNSKDDPVVIWLTGGPGCSSSIALFSENGPFHLTDNMSLFWNDYGWDKVSNIIYIDQPIGTGYSYSSSEDDLRHDEKGVSDDLYDFLQGFFQVHPEYVKNDLYITGESFGGHYIPAFASRINQGNKNKEGVYINLKGFAIGNGLTEPAIQLEAAPIFALVNNVINKTDYDRISQIVPACVKAAEECGTNGESSCLDALDKCDKIHEAILSVKHICIYDIRREKCYDMSRINKFLNMESVKKAVGVPQDIQFLSCSGKIYRGMKKDIMRNLEVGIPELLEAGIKMLVYAGEYDYICNWVGNTRWVEAMEWSGQRQFKTSRVVQFLVDGKEAGVLKNHGPLTFLKVHHAGHLVPYDQPKPSLQMLKTWIDGKLN